VLTAAGENRLQIRPPGCLTPGELEAARRLKGEILSIVGVSADPPLSPFTPFTTLHPFTASAEGTPGSGADPFLLTAGPAPGSWDAPAADAALAVVNARLARALAEGGEADTPARRNVVEAYRRVVAGYHRDRHPLLQESLEATEALLARWRSSAGSG
jgi:hypothetical protein